MIAMLLCCYVVMLLCIDIKFLACEMEWRRTLYIHLLRNEERYESHRTFIFHVFGSEDF
jgi:hypothetical protein